MIPLTGLLGRMESAPVLEMMAKEVVGINAPKIAITRSNDERVDVAVSELGNTAGTFAGGLAANRAVNRILKKGLSQSGTQAAKIATAGSSLAFFSVLFSFMWAMPFLRNYITTRRTGSTQFTQVIGGGQDKQAQDPELVKAALKDYRNKTVAIFGLGAAGAVLSVLAARAGLAGKAGMQNLAKLPAWLVMDKGLFKNINWQQQLLFWGVPAYGGWIHASRDNFERKEQLLKFGAFVGAFFGPGALLNKIYGPRFAALGVEKPSLANIVNKLGNVGENAGLSEILSATKAAPQGSPLQKAVRHWRNKNLWGIGSSIVLLGVLPQVLNIYLTKRRMSAGKAPAQQTVLPRGDLRYKPMQAWGRQGYLAASPVQGRMT